jgi:uncharacterized protein (TIGR02246 family)
MPATTPPASMLSAADNLAARSLLQHMIDAWKRGNGHGFAAAFSDTADFIAFEGSHLRGRQHIARFHQQLFETVLRGSRLEGETRFVRALGPELAVMHAWGSTALSGQARTLPSRDSMQLFVLMKREGRWYVEAMLNARKLTLEQQRFADDFAALPAEAQRQVTELIATLSGRSSEPRQDLA